MFLYIFPESSLPRSILGTGRMLIQDSRGRQTRLLEPLIIVLAKRGIKPRYLSHAATVLSICFAGAFWAFETTPTLFVLLPAILLLRMVLFACADTLVDQFARQQEPMKTILAIEKLVGDTFLILPFAVVEPFSVPWILAILALVWLVEIRSAFRTTHNRLPGRPGPMNRSGCMIIFALLGLLVWFSTNLSPVLYWFQPIMCLSVVITLFRSNRMSKTFSTSHPLGTLD